MSKIKHTTTNKKVKIRHYNVAQSAWDECYGTTIGYKGSVATAIKLGTKAVRLG